MMNDNNNALIAFFIGAVAGAATALLMAPQSGAETRATLRRGREKVLDRGSEVIDNVKESVSQGAEKAKGVASSVGAAAKEATATYRREMAGGGQSSGRGGQSQTGGAGV
jgi:gas vesicle protein